MLESFVYVTLDHADGRQEASQKSGRHGNKDGEEQDGSTEPDVTHTRHLVGKELDQQINAEVSQNQTQGPTAKRDHNRLGEQWLHNSAAGSAERGADRDLLAAAEGAGEDE